MPAVLRRLVPALLALVALFAVALPAARADVLTFGTSLVPEAAGATGSGTAWFHYDTVTHDLRVVADWTGLAGTTTAAHIHCCVAPPGTAPVAVTPVTLPGFPLGVTAGHYDAVIDLDDLASYTGAFLSNWGGGTAENARNALLAAFVAGTAYLNIHTNAFPAGAIRGFVSVPEPASLALLGLGLVLAMARRRR